MRLGRTSLLNLTGSSLGTLSTFGLVALLSQEMGLERAGLYFEAVGLVTVASVVCTWGISPTLVRALSRRLALGEHDVWTVYLAAAMPIAVLTVAVAGVGEGLVPVITRHLASSQSQPELAGILRGIIPALPPVTLIQISASAALGVGGAVPTPLYVTGGMPVLRLLLTIVIVTLSAPAWLLGGAWTIVAVALVPFSAIHMRVCFEKVGATRPQRTLLAGAMRELWTAAAPRGLEETLLVANTWLLIILVGGLATAATADIYTAASRAAGIPAIVLQAVGLALGPVVSTHLARGARLQAERVYRRAILWVSVTTFPICMTLLVFPQFILNLIGGDLLSGARALQILAIAMTINMCTGPINILILMAGRNWWNLLSALLGAMAMFLTAFLLIPRDGAVGAAYAWAAALLAQNVTGIMFSTRLLKIGLGGRLASLLFFLILAAGSLAILARTLFGGSLLAVSLALLSMYACMAIVAHLHSYGVDRCRYRARL